MSGYWYVATPYSLYPMGMDAAYEDANEAAARLVVEHGLRVFCPIAHSHSLCAAYGTRNGIRDATDAEFWKWLDEPMLEAACGVAVVMMDSWEISGGVAHEIETAEAMGKPVRYFTWPDLEETSAPR